MPPRKTDISQRLEAKTGIPGLARLLAERLSGSELSSLLLEIFDRRTSDGAPAQLLQQYENNRFVQPAAVDMIGLLRLELDTLICLRERGFQPVELSPAAVLGTCSILGTVSQDKILSAVRNTEIMADASNSLALHIAATKKNDPAAAEVMRLCTVQRHIRAQSLKEKGHTPHFKIGCMVTSGKDTGGYAFECSALAEQLLALCALYLAWGVATVRVKLLRRDGYSDPDRLLREVFDHLRSLDGLPEVVMDAAPAANNYYDGIQFKLIIGVDGREIEIADGGFVDWTQQLLANRKERLLISGFGLEWLYKLRSGDI
jgi:hypothetical protein